ncbi:hypothetical protein ABZ135_12600 [Streptomyces sp. NPDC006339]|uniref:hypothetical protein n=1 Tax=Streptomyces sp. NPDC006339 TaxID=3156755 RepID=UPI0033BEDD48
MPETSPGDVERLAGYLAAARRACGAPTWPDVPEAVRRLVAERDRAKAAVDAVLAWCDDLDGAARIRHGDPYAEDTHAIALRALLSSHLEHA